MASADETEISYSLLRLPVSYEWREQLLKNQILEIEQGIEELEDSGAEKFSV